MHHFLYRVWIATQLELEQVPTLLWVGRLSSSGLCLSLWQLPWRVVLGGCFRAWHNLDHPIRRRSWTFPRTSWTRRTWLQSRPFRGFRTRPDAWGSFGFSLGLTSTPALKGVPEEKAAVCSTSTSQVPPLKRGIPCKKPQGVRIRMFRGAVGRAVLGVPLAKRRETMAFFLDQNWRTVEDSWPQLVAGPCPANAPSWWLRTRGRCFWAT